MVSYIILFCLLAIVALSNATCSVYYTVVSGDTCYAIWSRYGLSSSEYYKVNPALSSSSCALSVSQSVCVRSLEDAGTCNLYGAISSGDTCSSLLQKYNPGLSLSKLLLLNSQINAGCSNLVPGQLLCFQGSFASSSSSSSLFSASSSSSLPSSSSMTATLSSSSAKPTTSVSGYSSAVLMSTAFQESTYSSLIGPDVKSSGFRTSSTSVVSPVMSQSFVTSTSSRMSTSMSLLSSVSSSGTTSTATNSSTLVSSMPDSTALAMNFTNSLPFVCNSTYVPVLNDTCASIALNFSISVSQLIAMNPTLSCTSVQASKPLCVRDGRPGCLSFTTIGASDTCASIAARGQIGLQALLSYNPDLNCSMLAPLESMPVCISAMPLVCSSSPKATYQVNLNETCASIAAARNTTVQDIIELNPLADCSILGAGTNQLCVLRDQSAGGGSEFVNYQLLSVLVHAFSPSDPGLMDLYQTFMTAPTQNNSDTVMHELMTLFVTSRGQQTLLDLEQSNPLISELETAYAGKTRSDYCVSTARADPNSDAGAVHACFCGNAYPFLTCISKMWSLYTVNGTPSSNARSTRRRRDQSRKSTPRLEQPAQMKRGLCSTSPPWDEVWGKLDLSVEVSQDGVKSSGKNQACAGVGCCVPLPGFDILCAGISGEICAIADLSAYARALLKGETSSAAWQEEAAEIADTTHSSIQIEICVTGVEELEKFGLDLCEPIAEVDIYPIKGDIDWTLTIGVVLFYVEFDGTVHHAGRVDIGQCADCTDHKQYCFAQVGESWFDGVSLVINLLFFKLRFDLGGGHTPSCPADYQPPSIDAMASRKPGKHLGAYYGNWNIWTVDGGTFTPISDSEASKLDSITYAFATVSYYTDPTGATDPGYYIDFTDWYGDIAKDLGDSCSPVDMSTVCTDATGAKKIATAPYIGAFGGSSCPVLQCNNTQGPNGGSGRSPACQTLIDVSQLPVKHGQPSLCGQMGYVLNTLRSKNAGMQALISVGGWYDSNYFAWATEPHIFLDGFVKSIEAFVTYFGWDGVDIDWEYPEWFHGGQLPPPMLYGKQSKNDANTEFLRGADYAWVQSHKPDDIRHVQSGMINQFNYLIGYLRQGLGPNKSISIAAASGADKYLSQTDGTNFASVLCGQDPDLIINLMTYDMHGAFDNPNGMTAHQAPIDNMSWYKGPGAGYSVRDAVNNWLSSCDNVRVGIPFYGRAYLGVSPRSTCGLGQPFSGGPVDEQGNVVLPSYSNIINGGYSIYHDGDNHEAAYGISPSGEFVSFEDAVSLSQKLNYTIGNGLEGAFYWLAGDDPDGSLSSLMWTALQNSSSPKQSGTHCAEYPGQVSSAVGVSQPSMASSSMLQSTSGTVSSQSTNIVGFSSSFVPSVASSLSSAQTNDPLSSSQTLSTTSSSPLSSSTPDPSASLVDHWGTCGGQGYTGPTSCAPPYVCKVISQWYSQCL